MFLHNEVAADIQSQSRAFSGGLGGEEGIEDLRLVLLRDAGTVVLDLDDDPRAVSMRSQYQRALTVHGVDGVVDDVRPYLVQLARVRLNYR